VRIAVVTAVMKTGERAGAEALYEGLVRNLRKTSHEVEQIEVVIDETSFDAILESYVTCYDLNLHDYDVVISTKAPTYMVRHRHHVSYLLHTIRVFYDMFEREFGRGSAEQHKQRRLIHVFDKYGLHPDRVRKHFTNGHTTFKRLHEADPFWRQIAFEALHHPPALEGFKEPRPGEYIFLPSRLHRWKRVDLVIKAFKYVKKDIPLKIAGTGEDQPTLRELASGDPRIEFLGLISDEQLLDLYAGALVVPFIPLNEDYGLITIEAFRSKKPVITCVDSGEPTCFVKDFETGFVVEPHPEALAERIKYLIDHSEHAAEMGRRGFETVSHITWDKVVSKLLASSDAETRERRGLSRGASIIRPQVTKTRTKILVTDNQVLDPPVGGGRLRIYHLYRNLAQYFSITYVGAYDWPGPEYREQMLASNFTEIVVPLTQVHFRLNSIFQRLTGRKVVIDVTMPLLLKYTPRFSEVANAHANGAEVIIISHPWVYPYVKRRREQILVYDSQNCEYLVKKELLSSSLIGRILVNIVKKVEGELCRASDLVFACSEDDKSRFVGIHGIDEDKVVIIPNGVDVKEIRPPAGSEKSLAKRNIGMEGKTTILFVGSGYQPNAEAVEYIVKVLAPGLHEYEFLIMGGVGEFYLKSVRATADVIPSNIHFFGTVEERVRDVIYKASDVAINPMFAGSGTNIKMFDYMAAGIPVITTLRGARGIETSDSAFIICEGRDFAENIERVLRNKELYDALSKKGRNLVEDKYDWRIVAEKAYAVIQDRLEKAEGKNRWGPAFHECLI